MNVAPGGQAWHAGPALLAAYAGGRAGSADAWSAEAHLTGCALCRAELAAYVLRIEADRALLASSRARLLADTGHGRRPSMSPRVSGRRRLAGHGAAWHVRWVLRPLSLGAVLLAVLAAVVVTGVLRLAVPGPGDGWLLWLLFPAVPVAGVALCSFGDEAAGGEAELATPSAGWRLLLWRTVAVLVTALPVALAAGWALAALPPPLGNPPHLGPGMAAAGSWLPALWLLPALALTVVTLAVGTWVALPRAATFVAGLWALAVLVSLPHGGLLTWGDGPGARYGVAGAVHPWALHLLDAGTQPGWALLLLAALAVVALRREAFGRMPTATRRWTGGARA